MAPVSYTHLYNSTYFDEIYHARTAYEHLHGEPTYEYTHPPLGKVLMMVGIELFGMTPFGWRFMGAVMGVLMVPLMYLLVKQLTKSTKLSFIAMFLLAVDSMHFTQTRIATIDSYAVFWIMLMYFFMFRYFQMRWTSAQAFRRSLIPLGLCGVTMGIAWATKWIGIYASAGLAVLFFWSLYRRWREYRYARAHMDKGENAELCAAVAEVFSGGAVATLAFCVVFFIVIPVLIYYFSYFWYLRGISEASWAAKGVAGFKEMCIRDSSAAARGSGLRRDLLSPARTDRRDQHPQCHPARDGDLRGGLSRRVPDRRGGGASPCLLYTSRCV